MPEKESVPLSRKIKALFRGFLGAIGLWIIPYPIFVFRRSLAGRTSRNGDMEFYCHPRFAITSHVIVMGWLVTLGVVLFDNSQTVQWFVWPWLLIIGFTFVAMGRNWEIISSIIVGGGILLVIAVLVILEMLGDWALFRPILDMWKQIPVEVDWGVPFILSFCLGFLYVLMACYQRVDNVWRLPASGNLLDHYRFERSDTSISKGGKTFRADWPCMLKKWFFFGYGNILILDAHSKRVLHRIEGVFSAHKHAEILKHRFATTDTREATEDELAASEEQEEIAADELL